MGFLGLPSGPSNTILECMFETMAGWRNIDEMLIDAIADRERVRCQAEAEQAQLMTLLARRQEQLEATVAEIAAVLHISRRAAGRRLHIAATVTDRLPATFAAWQAGHLDAIKAGMIADATQPLTDHAAAAV